MRQTILTRGEQGFAHRVELWDGEELLHILETDDWEEALRFSQTHFPFQNLRG